MYHESMRSVINLKFKELIETCEFIHKNINQPLKSVNSPRSSPAKFRTVIVRKSSDISGKFGQVDRLV